jgi:hypothetical protein
MPAVLDQNSKLARNPKGMKGLMDPSFLNFSGDDEVETMLNSFKVRRNHMPYLWSPGERNIGVEMVTLIRINGLRLSVTRPCLAIRSVPDSRFPRLYFFALERAVAGADGGRH